MSASRPSGMPATPLADARGAGACSTWFVMSRLLSPSKSGLPGEQEIADGADRVDVRARVDVRRIEDPLGRHVARRARGS